MVNTKLTTLALLGTAPLALAGRLNFMGARRSHLAEYFPELASSPQLHRRGAGEADLTDAKDGFYLTNITLNGAPFTVLIDTGSSDLWINSKLDNATGLGKTGSITYVAGAASGELKTADLVVAGYTVKDQVFMAADENHTGQQFGVFGLGPNAGAMWAQTLNSSALAEANAFTRIFAANASSQLYITTALGRATDDPLHPYQGQMTIDEVLPGYEAVLQQPKLNVTTPDEALHWQTLLDVGGLLVNGQSVPLPTTTVASTADPAQLTVVYDNGFSLPQLPRQMVDAIYAHVPGAAYNATSNLYTLPCTAELNVTFKFGGASYPVHPLDTVGLGLLATPPVTGCIGTFQPMTVNLTGQVDVILGMSFLRNVYMLNSFGAFARINASAPYTQLLSLNNDTAAMHSEFVKIRTSGAVRAGTAGAAAAAMALAAALLLW